MTKEKMTEVTISKRPILRLKPRDLVQVVEDNKKPVEQVKKKVVSAVEVAATTRESTETRREKHLAIFLDILKQVRKKYPTIFLSGFQPIPILAIGIHNELARELNIPVKLTKIFCKIYCLRKVYKDTRKTGAKRYNLKGEVTGEVQEYISPKKQQVSTAPSVL